MIYLGDTQFFGGSFGLMMLGGYGCFQKYGKTPKSSILIGFSIIFTIHFGG